MSKSIELTAGALRVAALAEVAVGRALGATRPALLGVVAVAIAAKVGTLLAVQATLTIL